MSGGHQEVVAVTPDSVRRFAEATGDWNPVHFDEEAARRAGLPGRCAHGLWLAGLAARHVTSLGHRVRAISARYEKPALVGGQIWIHLEEDGQGGFDWTVRSEDGERLARGGIQVESQTPDRLGAGSR